jgi:hypothetical protein
MPEMQLDRPRPQARFAGAQQLVPDLRQPDQPRCLGDPLCLHRMRLHRGVGREPERLEEVQDPGLELAELSD